MVCFWLFRVARVTFSGLVKLEAGAVRSRSFPRAGVLFLVQLLHTENCQQSALCPEGLNSSVREPCGRQEALHQVSL